MADPKQHRPVSVRAGPGPSGAWPRPLLSPALLLLALLGASPAGAQEARRAPPSGPLPSGKLLPVGQDRVGGGLSVEVTEGVAGDAMLTGGDVEIRGPVGGDVLAAGGRLAVLDSVGGSVRAAGWSVVVDGPVGRNVTAVGRSVTLRAGGSVGGSSYLSGGAVRVSAALRGPLRAAGRTVRVDGPVQGDVEVTADRLEVGAGARVEGELRYRVREVAVIDSAARIAGGTTRLPAPVTDEGPAWIGRLVRMAAFLATGAALVLLLPGGARRLDQTLERRPGAAAGYGLLWILLAPPTLLLCALTLVGVPLALLGAGLYSAALYLGRVVVAIWLGRRGLAELRRSEPEHPVGAFLAGGAAILLAGLVPVVGGLVSAVATLLGVGAGVVLASEGLSGGRPAAP